MDPLSFTASLITVAGLGAVSSKKIYDLRGKLKSVPKDVEELLEQLNNFETLLKELEGQLQDYRNSALTQDTLQQVWGASIQQMRGDVESLQADLSKLEPLLKKKSKSSKVLLLARQILSEEVVEQHKTKIRTHSGTLSNIQAIVCGKKLDRLSESVSQFGNEIRGGFQTVSTQLDAKVKTGFQNASFQLSNSSSRLEADSKAGVSTVMSQLIKNESANKVSHQTVLAHLRDQTENGNLVAGKIHEVFQRQARSIDISEAASSSNSKEHKATRAILSQCQGLIQEIVRNHINFQTIDRSVHSPPSRPKAVGRTSTTEILFWRHRRLCLSIGVLDVNLSQTRKTKRSRRSDPQIYAKSKLRVVFVPPRWLSNIVITYSMNLYCDLISSQWRWGATLAPLTINENPFFIDAIKSLNIEDLRTSFLKGLAKPTDHVLIPGHVVRPDSPEPWYKMIFWSHSFQDQKKISRLCSLFDFMVENGFPDQQQSFYMKWCIETQPLKTLGGQQVMLNSIFGRMHVEWIPDLLKSSELWLMEDLDHFSVLFIGTLAHVDHAFRTQIEKTLASYRSPLSSGRESFANNRFESIFGVAYIKSSFYALDNLDKNSVMVRFCQRGSASMVKFHLDVGPDEKRDMSDRYRYLWYSHLLGVAAVEGETDIVRLLLKLGAPTSSAISLFFQCGHKLPDQIFRRMLELLVKKSRLAQFHRKGDPLIFIMRPIACRARSLYPKAPEILLNRAFSGNRRLGRNQFGDSYLNVYMYHTIMFRYSSVLDLLLRNGAIADATISELSFCKGKWFEPCTWTTFSVLYGAAACADVLIRHGADVTALDQSRRSAIQLANMNILASHPRTLSMYVLGEEWASVFQITAEQDAETLAVVERAFNDRFQGSRSLEEYMGSMNELPVQPPLRPERPKSIFRKIVDKALGKFLNTAQTERLHNYLEDLCAEARKTWSLSFPEALLTRFLYILSYALLLGLEIRAIINGQRRIPMPSRSLLSAVALLTLAIIWGSSQFDLLWGSSAAGSQSESGS